MPLSPAQQEEIKQFLKKRNKIAAIKLYREATGAGLKEAKERVEEIEDTLAADGGLNYQKAEVKGGCFGVVALLLAGLLTTVVMLLSRS